MKRNEKPVLLKVRNFASEKKEKACHPFLQAQEEQSRPS